jgi:hypothetical protein
MAEQRLVRDSTVSGVRPASAIDPVDLRQAGAALNAQRWSVRAQIGAFFQRASIRLLGSATAAGCGLYVGEGNWQNALFVGAGLALIGAASAAGNGLRYRRQFALRWGQDIEHLALRLAPMRQDRLRVLDVATDLQVTTAEAEAVLEHLRKRSLVSIVVDAEGQLVYVFPSRR